jgi:hypothetical protein
MQLTLRYMTKLDRAINNEKELKELEKFYQLHNISALDLFNILVEVRVQLYTLKTYRYLPLPHITMPV